MSKDNNLIHLIFRNLFHMQVDNRHNIFMCLKCGEMHNLISIQCSYIGCYQYIIRILMSKIHSGSPDFLASYILQRLALITCNHLNNNNTYVTLGHILITTSMYSTLHLLFENNLHTTKCHNISLLQHHNVHDGMYNQ